MPLTVWDPNELDTGSSMEPEALRPGQWSGRASVPKGLGSPAQPGSHSSLSSAAVWLLSFQGRGDAVTFKVQRSQEVRILPPGHLLSHIREAQ